jgi:hypothetical protein
MSPKLEKKNRKETTPKHIIIKSWKTREKVKILKEAGEKHDTSSKYRNNSEHDSRVSTGTICARKQ